AGMLGCPLRGRGDRGNPAAALAAEGVADHLAEVETARAHAEEGEAEAEDDDHQRESPLRLRPQAGEEEGAFYRARGAAAAGAGAGAPPASGGASMARLARCAAAVNSCHSNPPFSRRASPFTNLATPPSPPPPQ